MNKMDFSYIKAENFAKGGAAFVHMHQDKKGIVEVINKWRKIGNRYLANCSWCGSRSELVMK